MSLTRNRCQHNVDIVGYKLQQATRFVAHQHKWYTVPRKAILHPAVQSHQHISYEFRSWLASRHILEFPSHLQAPSPQLYLYYAPFDFQIVAHTIRRSAFWSSLCTSTKIALFLISGVKFIKHRSVCVSNDRMLSVSVYFLYCALRDPSRMF